MVKEVADPEALFMLGAAFDETLEDEIRVTVIATGFGGVANPVPGTAKEEAKAKGRDEFSIKPPVPIAEEPEEPESDPFDDIFRIFNKGK